MTPYTGRKGVIATMIKNKDRIIQEKTDKLTKRLKSYVDEMDDLSETNEFTIDNIEARWGELEAYTQKVYREVNDEIVRQFDEREIIRSKKANTQKRG